ncbi:MAG: hypothetical protein K6F58_02850 [Bacteroidales bacterium]|nr:hypothetical protein [Bacteroidales bacterium]
MKVFVAVLVLLGLCVLGMSVGILAGRSFPKGDVDENEELCKRGISCYKHEDARLQGKAGKEAAPGCNGNYSDACRGCAFFELEKK